MEIKQYQERPQLPKRPGAGADTRRAAGEQGVALHPGRMLRASSRRTVPGGAGRDLAAHPGAAPGQAGERGESDRLQLCWGN